MGTNKQEKQWKRISDIHERYSNLTVDYPEDAELLKQMRAFELKVLILGRRLGDKHDRNV